MIAAFIFVFVSASLQFSLAYCRTLLEAYGKVEFSQRVTEVTGLNAEGLDAGEFDHLMGYARHAGDPGDDAREVRAVSIYYPCLALAGASVSPFSQAARGWFAQEQVRCTFFAAVTLGGRLVPSAN